MTAYVIQIERARVSVASDTAMVHGATRERAGVQDKVFPSAALGGLLACTGSVEVGDRLQRALFASGLIEDFDQAAEFIDDWIDAYRADFGRTDVLWVGRSPTLGYTGLLFTADHGRQTLGPGVWPQPILAGVSLPIPLDETPDPLTLLRRQKAETKAHIGGPAWLWTLDDSGVRATRLGDLDHSPTTGASLSDRLQREREAKRARKAKRRSRAA